MTLAQRSCGGRQGRDRLHELQRRPGIGNRDIDLRSHPRRRKHVAIVDDDLIEHAHDGCMGDRDRHRLLPRRICETQPVVVDGLDQLG